MKITVNANHTAASLQQAFNKLFPRLSLHLFKMPHEKGEGSPKAERALPESLLSEWLEVDEVTIELNPKMTVGELEARLQDYGIFAQVFRKSGDLWLETTRTDGWTLERVNEESY
jgi:hypothetical protein